MNSRLDETYDRVSIRNDEPCVQVCWTRDFPLLLGASLGSERVFKSDGSGFWLDVVDADADVVVPVVVVADMLEARSSRVTSTGYTLVDPPKHIRYTPGRRRAHSGFNWYQLRLNHVADTGIRCISYPLIRRSN